MRAIFFLLLVSIYACNNDDKIEDPILCTQEARPGIKVTVKDAKDTMFLVEKVEVIVIDGEYKETLQHVTDTNIFIGAYERTGIYTIIVGKEGYDTVTNDPITVTKDMCHVITKNIEVFLSKK